MKMASLVSRTSFSSAIFISSNTLFYIQTISYALFEIVAGALHSAVVVQLLDLPNAIQQDIYVCGVIGQSYAQPMAMPCNIATSKL